MKAFDETVSKLTRVNQAIIKGLLDDLEDGLAYGPVWDSVVAKATAGKNPDENGKFYVRRSDLLRHANLTEAEAAKILKWAVTMLKAKRVGKWYELTTEPKALAKASNDYLRMRQREDGFARKIFDVDEVRVDPNDPNRLLVDVTVQQPAHVIDVKFEVR